MYEYKCSIVRVVDGDTVDIFIDLGFGVWLRGINGKGERVRLEGVDTPETRTRDPREKRFGQMASARVKGLLPVGHKAVVRTTLDSKGKFGRALADFKVGKHWLCALLLREHLAVAYHGQNKDDVRKEHEANWEWLDQAIRSTLS